MSKPTEQQVKIAAFKVLTENNFIRTQEGIDKFEMKLREELGVRSGVFRLQSMAELDHTKREVPEIIYFA